MSGQGQTYRIKVGGSWILDEHFTLFLRSVLGGVTTQVGYGAVTGIEPTYAFTYKRKLYVLAGTSFYFSAIDLPTTFNDPNATGNGYVDVSDNTATAAELKALAPYQGKMGVLGRNTSQIWAVDPDPANYLLTQDLINIGTVGKLTPKSLGDLDIYFLSDSGFRSIRVRDASNNAIITDAGSPIDKTVQDVLISMTSAEKDDCCGAVEPNANRYMCWVDDKMYVLSDFRESKILAWSTYTLPATPEKFEVSQGLVYFRSENKIYVYGGLDGVTYDSTVASWSTFWMDGKNPSTRKSTYAIDAAFTGAWTITFGMDPAAGTLATIYTHNAATYWQGRIPVTQNGYFFKIAGATTGATAATFDAFSILYRSHETT